MFCDNLKEYRKQKGYSQTQLGQRIGVTRQAISRWESGIDTPSLERIAALARVLGVSIDALAGVPVPPGGGVRIDHEAMIDVPVLSREVVACCGDGIGMMDITSGAEPGVQIPRSLLTPISKTLLIKTLRVLGYPPEEMSAHGFRATASTLLNETGWPPDAIEAQLAHYVGGTVRAAYNHAQYLPVRRQMLQWYADYLDALRDGQPAPPMPPH